MAGTVLLLVLLSRLTLFFVSPRLYVRYTMFALFVTTATTEPTTALHPRHLRWGNTCCPVCDIGFYPFSLMTEHLTCYGLCRAVLHGNSNQQSLPSSSRTLHVHAYAFMP